MVRKELPGGLILRSISEGHETDRKGLMQLYNEVFTEAGDEDVPTMLLWTEDLLSGHPTTTGDDIWVIVDPAKDNRVVSALLLIPQVWRYEEIKITIGRVELVATDKEYRRRGLTRALMNMAHERSAELDHSIQAITGIPYFYRQFGYVMAVNLGVGPIVFLSAIRDLKENQQAQYTLRPATEADIPDLVRWDQWIADQSLLSTIRSEDDWRYELKGRQSEATFNMHVLIVQNAKGAGVGYLGLQAPNYEDRLTCYAYVVGDESSYLDTYDDVIRGLRKFANEQYADNPPQYAIFDSGLPEALNHLVERTFPAHNREEIYAWFLRVPDPVQFIQQITPVLERRLVGSGGHRFTGKLTIDTYERQGIRIEFEKGKIMKVSMQPADAEDYRADCAFPWDFFWSIVFGHRSIVDLRRVLSDVWMNRKANVLLNVLFPKKRSWLMPLS